MALVLALVGERSIDAAVALEGAGDGIISRGGQKVGGALGTALAGAAMGAVFGIVFAAVRHRLPGRADWQRVLWLATAAWITVHLVPGLKYPPNPPAVGDPDTVGRRTAAYLLLLVFSVVAVVAAARLRRWLDAQAGLSDQARAVLPVAAWAALIVLALVVFPPASDDVALPAQLVWRFRLESLAGTLVHWAVTGVALGFLLDARRSAGDRTRR